MEAFIKFSLFVNFGSVMTFQLFLVLLFYSSINKGSEAAKTSTAAVPTLAHLKVSYACDSMATLTWTKDGTTDKELYQTCELTYYLSGKNSFKFLDINVDSPTHTISLFNLTNGKIYTAFISCGDQLKTNEVLFTSDSVCIKAESTNHTHADSNTETGPTYAQEGGFDMVDWPIAATFAVVGVIIGAVVAYYMWKKYQRRQRILRIFRQGQNDPFQALYSPTQDSYSF